MKNSWKHQSQKHYIVGKFSLLDFNPSPFHGGNRGSTPLGDATFTATRNHYNIELNTIKIGFSSCFANYNDESHLVTFDHTKTFKITPSFVKNSWKVNTAQYGGARNGAYSLFETAVS